MSGKTLQSTIEISGVLSPSLQAAIKTAYSRVTEVHFDNAFYRNDIGGRALAALTEGK